MTKVRAKVTGSGPVGDGPLTAILRHAYLYPIPFKGGSGLELGIGSVPILFKGR